MSFDSWVLDSAVSARTPWLVDVVDVITDSGGTLAAWSIASVLTITLLMRARRVDAVQMRARRVDALLVAGSMLTGLLVMTQLKHIFTRTRPPIPERLVDIDSYSFPSGHAMMTAILATVVAAVIIRLTLPRLTKVTMLAVLAVYTVAVGFSRVYLAAHWMTDVLAGWAFGVIWAGLWIWGTSRLRRRQLQPA
ncbi:phosphatase PAP2 family protein [Rhodococcus sp. IEGM 1379]|uniref:phosphatase PAP2 family protein n=1 Tax=Rhodococcus sp. IEGM 1379 TaxID=3047086 RepID=UPI0024B65172|nr:phosphatase PAP2 family protein [Rhodococcus sp. IEGM 1379]MDI9914867.1 phosphatase PAP2 family protein [Rhodococcus sp. IEGM 1379]